MEVKEVRSLGALASRSWVPRMPEPPGSHFLPLPSRPWQGWGKGQSIPARGQKLGSWNHDLRSQAEIQFELCAEGISLLFLFFFFELWHSHKQRYPLPQQLHHVRLLPLPFWFCCWMPEGLGGVGGEDLAHAPPPSERAAALGFLLSG